MFKFKAYFPNSYPSSCFPVKYKKIDLRDIVSINKIIIFGIFKII